MTEQRIWDLPLRVFHWSLALSVILAVITARTGGNAMEWHMRLGYAVLTLLFWRLAWGFVGGHWSRFAAWPLWAWVRRSASAESRPEFPGHSPRGAWASAGLLVLVGLQALTGLVADDEIATAGPWAARVDAQWSALATNYHHGLGQWLVLGMIALHLLALSYYTWVRREALVAAMVHGRKVLRRAAPDSGDGAKLRALGLLLGLCSLAMVLLLVS